MAGDAWLYILAGVAFLGTSALILWRSRAGTGLFLAAFLLIDGLHAIAHGAPALTTDPRLGQALTNTFHVPSFLGFLAGALFVSGFTGIHRAFWRHPAVMALSLLVFAALLAAELAVPTPFWVFNTEGVHLVDGTLGAWADLEGFGYLLLDLYFIAVVAAGLRRQRAAATIPGHALLLAFFLIREAPVVWDFASSPGRWGFLGLAGLAPPAALVPTGLHLEILVTAGFAALPLAAVWGAPSGRAREAGAAAVALAVLVSAVVAAGSGGSIVQANLRVFFATLLLGYAALRHGLVGAGRVGPPSLELPLAAAGLGTLLFLFVLALGDQVPGALAVAAGAGLALVAASLTLTVAGVSLTATGGVRERSDLFHVLGDEGDVVLGRFRLGAFLGRGSAGRTYAARDTHSGRDVVLKLLPPVAAQAEAVAREARAMAALEHPRIVRLHGVEPTPQGTVLVLEHVKGGSLADRIAQGPLPPAAFRAVAEDLLEALGAVHAAGLVHRDVKPSNVLLTLDGRAKLADFGVAQAADPDATLGVPGGDPEAAGTLRYMSPEQAQGVRVGPASDLYGAAATLYEALTGEPLVQARPNEGVAELRARVAAAGPFDRPVPGPPGLQAWFARALAPSPRARFADARDMEASLRGALEAGSRRRRALADRPAG